jgi:hypothetical protein
MRKTHAVVLVVFAWMMIGAQDCNPWAGEVGPDSPKTSTPVNYCTTDPPVDCAGLCIIMLGLPEGMSPPPPSPTPGCAGGGGLTQQFVTDIQTTLVCDESMPSYAVLPPFFHITPQVTQTGNCTPPPALPDMVSLAVFMGYQ